MSEEKISNKDESFNKEQLLESILSRFICWVQAQLSALISYNSLIAITGILEKSADILIKSFRFT